MFVDACTLCKGNCWNCFYADVCGVWLDDLSIPVPQIEVDEPNGNESTDLVNLTPHAITLITGNGNRVIEPSGTVARVSVETATVDSIDGIPVTQSVFGEVENLPEPKENTIYIVSSLVAQRVPEREDVFIPNESVRDEQGKIVGCKSLGRV